MEPAGLTDTLGVVCVTERRKSKMVPRVWARKSAGGLKSLFGGEQREENESVGD